MHPRHFFRRWALFLSLALLCGALVHCDPGENPPPPPPPNGAKEFNLTGTQYDLPAAAFSKEGFYAGSLSTLGTLLGDKGGVYHLSNSKLNTLTLDPVVGIAPWRGQYLLVANPKQLNIFDGALEPLNLAEKLGLKDTEITCIAAQGKDVMWIGTKAHLWRLRHDTLDAFKDIKAIEQLIAFPGAKEIIVVANKGQITILRSDDKGQVQTYKMPAESPKFTQLFPSLDGSLWGLAEKKLYLRQTKDGESRWVPYIFGATDDNPEGEAIAYATLDNTTGQVWAVGEKNVFVLSADKAQQAKRPDTLKDVKQIAAAGDTLWVSDGKQLHLFVRKSTENVTYAGQVTLFMKQNCLRCHEQVGPGRPLDSYELTKQHIDSIIKQIESGAMPADKKPLKDGDVNTFKQWRKNNFSK